MNIDLFLNKAGEPGLIMNIAADEQVSGVILDAETNLLTLEFGDSGETLHLNIPVEDHNAEQLLFAPFIQVAAIEDGFVTYHVEVPLLYLNDPYGSAFGENRLHRKKRRFAKNLLDFETFMRYCSFSQAVHRDELGDEGTAGSVLSGSNLSALQYAPQLVRQRSLEAGLHAAQSLQQGLEGPQMAPKGPGGMSMGSGSGARRTMPRMPRRAATDDDQD